MKAFFRKPLEEPVITGEHPPLASPDDGESCPVATPPKTASTGKTFLWVVISLAVAVLSIWAITSQNKHFSFRLFLRHLSEADKFWLTMAFAAMLGFILFEALAFRTMLRGLGYRRSLFANFTYAATDIYFSAITPSATGGQPASAYIMMQSGVSGSATTVTILMCLAMYALSLIIIGVTCFLARPDLFLLFSPFSRVMIVIGMAVQVGLAFVFVLFIRKGHLLCKIACKLITFGSRLHIIKHPERRIDRLQSSLGNYRLCAEMTAGKKGMLLKTLLLNVLQRASQITVTVFVFIATEKALGLTVNWTTAIDIFAIQSYVLIGGAYVPIPGGMGIFDLLLLDSLGAYMVAFLGDACGEAAAVDLELMSRAISFYACILLCGLTVFVIFTVHKLRGKKLR